MEYFDKFLQEWDNLVKEGLTLLLFSFFAASPEKISAVRVWRIDFKESGIAGNTSNRTGPKKGESQEEGGGLAFGE